jgi:hypothetical protein
VSHVLVSPDPLSARARGFLARHGRRVAVDPGPTDEQCRAEMRAVRGSSDDGALALLRGIQRRYSGLTYSSPFIGQPVVFEPVLETDTGTDQVEFWYAIMPTQPDGCFSGSVHTDGSVVFGLNERDVRAFPSLDHFLECDAMLDFAREQTPVDCGSPADLPARWAALRAERPSLHRLDHSSGYGVEWWSDDAVLVHCCTLWQELGFAAARPTLQIWALDDPTLA